MARFLPTSLQFPSQYDPRGFAFGPLDIALSRLIAFAFIGPSGPKLLSLKLRNCLSYSPTGMHKVHLVPARTEGQRVDASLTHVGLAVGVEAFSFAWDRSEQSLECRLQQHLRGELVTSQSRPQTRSARGTVQSRGLRGSSGLRERGPELEAARARARWRPTPGASSCAVTIGLRERTAAVSLSSRCLGPPYRLRG